MNRTHFSHLPKSQELESILAKEAYRAVPSSKKFETFVAFDAINALLESYDLKSDYFDTEVFPAEVVSGGLIEKGEELIASLIARILATAPSHAQLIALNDAYDYLSEEDELEEADAIFVFGSKSPLRIKKAIQLYREGLAPKIIISGGNPFYATPEEGVRSEAEMHADIAISSGVPKDHIVLETESITIPDNVRRSLNMLEKTNEMPQSLILVNSPYTQRRGWAFFMKYTPEETVLMRSNSLTAETYQAAGWHNAEEGARVVLGEYVKLKVASSLNTA